MGGFAMHLQKYFDKKVYDNHLRFTLKDFIRYHEECGFDVIHASYTGFLSFNNLVFSNYSLAGRVSKIFIKLINAPIVCVFYWVKRVLNINFSSKFFSSNMIVVSKKR